MYKVLSYQIADSIDIKQVKTAFKSDICFSDSDELFYKTDQEQFLYIFKYGVVCFLNFPDIAVSSFLQFIAPYCKNPFAETLSEEFEIETNASENKIGYNKIEIIKSDVDVLRLVMLNVSESVALDYYSDQTTKLLEETNYHTQILEKKGRLDISGTNLKKYIGKTLLIKNRIAENLYIFDSPPETWEDESLNKIHNDLSRTFDLQERFRHVSEGLAIVKENLELFKDLLQHRNSNVLEWIVIGLITFEVLHVIFEELFR
ncbi:MAG: RMD1 family protein [Chitinophagaceae bacterium]|nr:RMD1 family protein [Chitinophagaceae bacterium]